ncbi:MAG: hypothetical protein V1845_01250 [bacterium]
MTFRNTHVKIIKEKFIKDQLPACRAIQQNILSDKEGEMSETADMILKNILGRDVIVRIDSDGNPNSQWASKIFTKSCHACRHCLGRQAALRVAGEFSRLMNGNEHGARDTHEMAGLCIWGLRPKFMATSRNGSKKCGLVTQSMHRTCR